MLFAFLNVNKLENVSMCTITALERNDINDVEEILSLAPHTLYNIKGIGDKGYREIIDAIEKLNINVDRYKYYLTASKKPFKSKNSGIYPFNLINDISNITISHLVNNYEDVLDYLVTTLPSKEQKIIELRYKEYHTVNECAEILGIAMGTVSRIQKRATEKLQYNNRSRYLFRNNSFSLQNAVEGLYIISLGLGFKLEKILTDLGYETIHDIMASLPEIKQSLSSSYYRKLLKSLERYDIKVDSK